MPKFRTAFDAHLRVCSCSGSQIVPEYVLAVKDNGVHYLKDNGVKNIYKMIQAHADTCDMNIIMRSLDPTMLSNAVSSFNLNDVDPLLIADLTNTPTSLGEALNSMKAAENLFNGLPLDVRREFNFSTSAFIKSAGSDKFNKLFGGSENVLNAGLPMSNLVVPSSVGTLDSAPVLTQAPVVTETAVTTAVKKKKKKVIEVEVDDDDE